MALKSVLNTAASYQETSKPIQKTNERSTSGQDWEASNTVAVRVETSEATKVLLEQQKTSEQDQGNQQKSDAEINAQRLKSAVEQANNKMKQVRTGCEFSYHEEVNRITIKVYDKATEEVIREIPQKKA